MVLYEKSSQEYAVNVDGITLYSKFDHAFDLWQQLEFASEPESDI